MDDFLHVWGREAYTSDGFSFSHFDCISYFQTEIPLFPIGFQQKAVELFYQFGKADH